MLWPETRNLIIVKNLKIFKIRMIWKLWGLLLYYILNTHNSGKSCEWRTRVLAVWWSCKELQKQKKCWCVYNYKHWNYNQLILLDFYFGETANTPHLCVKLCVHSPFLFNLVRDKYKVKTKKSRKAFNLKPLTYEKLVFFFFFWGGVLRWIELSKNLQLKSYTL